MFRGGRPPPPPSRQTPRTALWKAEHRDLLIEPKNLKSENKSKVSEGVQKQHFLIFTVNFGPKKSAFFSWILKNFQNRLFFFEKKLTFGSYHLIFLFLPLENFDGLLVGSHRLIFPFLPLENFDGLLAGSHRLIFPFLPLENFDGKNMFCTCFCDGLLVGSHRLIFPSVALLVVTKFVDFME